MFKLPKLLKKPSSRPNSISRIGSKLGKAAKTFGNEFTSASKPKTGALQKIKEAVIGRKKSTLVEKGNIYVDAARNAYIKIKKKHQKPLAKETK